ncbi:uncharacterized protein DC041_0000040 [Schistosoma bovis]|uniref:Uncharacterized protein n=1 Tax=Schistosoma bovis TaxID=6184 RepID=A0A430QAB4_SCHBO|nr:uncharacterized protein DC041_0000040 [Schistosoma bovis]
MFFSIAILKIILMTMYFNYLFAYRTTTSDEEMKHYSQDEQNSKYGYRRIRLTHFYLTVNN